MRRSAGPGMSGTIEGPIHRSFLAWLGETHRTHLPHPPILSAQISAAIAAACRKHVTSPLLVCRTARLAPFQRRLNSVRALPRSSRSQVRKIMIGSGSVRLDLDALRDHMGESWEAASLQSRSRAALELKDSKVYGQFVLRDNAEILEAIGCRTVLIGGGTTSPLR